MGRLLALTISNPRIIRGRSCSDIHFGANNTPTSTIIEGMNHYLTNDAVFSEIDLFILAGDLTDRLLTQPSLPARQTRDWIDHETDLAIKHDVVSLILEGTPLHDWKQPEYFVESNRRRNNASNMHYAKTVSIVFIEKLGIHVLFVPDEAHDTCQLTEIAVKTELALHGIEKVDVTVLHGQFRHQYPEHVRDKGMDFHSTDFYLSITRHFIFAGHIHSHTIYKRIVAHGSFERLAHGCESPKGAVGFELNLDDPTKSKVWFIENKGAQIYKTFKVTGENLQFEADKIRSYVAALPIGSFVRVQAKADHPILSLLMDFKKEFPMFHWSTDKIKEKRKQAEEIVSVKIKKVRVSIRPDNVAELLNDKFEELSETEKDEVLGVLEKIK